MSATATPTGLLQDPTTRTVNPGTAEALLSATEKLFWPMLAATMSMSPSLSQSADATWAHGNALVRFATARPVHTPLEFCSQLSSPFVPPTTTSKVTSGSMRAAVSLLHKDKRTACHDHPLRPPILPGSIGPTSRKQIMRVQCNSSRTRHRHQSLWNRWSCHCRATPLPSSETIGRMCLLQKRGTNKT
jgi:hypothetical protein